jgi:hypothetical protein
MKPQPRHQNVSFESSGVMLIGFMLEGSMRGENVQRHDSVFYAIQELKGERDGLSVVLGFARGFVPCDEHAAATAP